MKNRCAVAFALMVASCKGLDDGAKEEFSTSYTCPAARVEVRERTDIDIGEFEYPRHDPEPPPAEISSDPGRLAMWRKQHDDKDEEHRKYERNFHHLFEVHGCGHTVLYNCNRPGRGSSPSAYYMCSEEKRHYPAGTPAW